MKLGIDLKLDDAFKWLLGTQAQINNLRSFLITFCTTSFVVRLPS